MEAHTYWHPPISRQYSMDNPLYHRMEAVMDDLKGHCSPKVPLLPTWKNCGLSNQKTVICTHLPA